MYQENAWKKYSGESLDKLMQFNEDYKKYLSDSKTERLCVKNAIAICEANGFKELSTFETLKPGDKVYATNLVYVSDEIKKLPWFESVDCSENIAYVINELNYGRSIGDALKGRDEVLRRIRTITKELERENN